MATVGLKDQKVRKSIVQKTIKQFLNSNRPADKTFFVASCQYATGGVPSEWEFEKITEEYTSVKLTAKQRALADAQSTCQLRDF